MRSETTKTKQINDSTEMKVLKMIINKRRDYVKNEEIGNWFKIQPIND